MLPFEAEIPGLIMDVWQTLLALPIEAAGADARRGPAAYCSTVAIDGAWQGSVSLHWDEQLARAAAARLFQIEPAAVTEAQIHDALGEVANVAGGNFKALVPEPSVLSLPRVETCAALEQHAPKPTIACTLWFVSRQLPLAVTIATENLDNPLS